MKTTPGPLNTRIFRRKNPRTLFFCPLCRTERSLIYTASLQKKDYLKISLTSFFLIVLTYPLMQVRALCWFFVVWGCWEVGHKMLFRKDIPCPHCGFDATWYKRDVTKARQKVLEFWAPPTQPSSDEMLLNDETEPALPADAPDIINKPF